MFRKLFKEWATNNIENLNSINIATEFFTRKDIDNEKLFDPSTVIRHESQNCIGQVIVWESKQMEYEIFNIHTAERLLWNYFERVPDQPNFDKILKTYFDVLQTGLKP